VAHEVLPVIRLEQVKFDAIESARPLQVQAPLKAIAASPDRPPLALMVDPTRDLAQVSGRLARISEDS
jgi:hypothetical protein